MDKSWKKILPTTCLLHTQTCCDYIHAQSGVIVLFVQWKNKEQTAGRTDMTEQYSPQFHYSSQTNKSLDLLEHTNRKESGCNGQLQRSFRNRLNLIQSNHYVALFQMPTKLDVLLVNTDLFHSAILKCDKSFINTSPAASRLMNTERGWRSVKAT